MKRTDASQENHEVPVVLSLRLSGHELRPLIAKWRKRNKRVPWSALVEDALRRELAPLAGKRHAHLVVAANGEGKVAA